MGKCKNGIGRTHTIWVSVSRYESDGSDNTDNIAKQMTDYVDNLSEKDADKFLLEGIYENSYSHSGCVYLKLVLGQGTPCDTFLSMYATDCTDRQTFRVLRASPSEKVTFNGALTHRVCAKVTERVKPVVAERERKRRAKIEEQVRNLRT